MNTETIVKELRTSADEISAIPLATLFAAADRLEELNLVNATSPRISLDKYPNLDAVMAGCVSGSPSEWPLIRREISDLHNENTTLRARLEELERVVGKLPVKAILKACDLIYQADEGCLVEDGPVQPTGTRMSAKGNQACYSALWATREAALAAQEATQ